ncbi:MAG: hypothetical protein Faunusvirus30_7 [Faunusvirus sp.]|jgi:hypothetical protein|uniref:Uncharacterized protein n=1 Tax=Faunusvirus sp. TaxID=2487766 RepID=A0A3G4ZXJ1_9VIRU|nr:MAG: hypothetical protein Faunusvirus30_7 [Faunusvirus sp.]
MNFYTTANEIADENIRNQLIRYTMDHEIKQYRISLARCLLICTSLIFVFLILLLWGVSTSRNAVYHPQDDVTCGVYKTIDKCMLDCGCGFCSDGSQQCFSRDTNMCITSYWTPSDNDACRSAYDGYSTSYRNIPYVMIVYAVIAVLLIVSIVYNYKTAKIILEKRDLLMVQSSVIVTTQHPIESVEMSINIPHTDDTLSDTLFDESSK